MARSRARSRSRVPPIDAMKTIPPLVLALTLAGCATVPAIDTTTLPAAPAAFKEEGRWVAAVPAAASERGAWWKAFRDPVLDDLVERAKHGSTTLQAAAARLAQARAFEQSAHAQLLPQLGAGASAARADGLPVNRAGAPSTLVTAGASLAYEVDLFGKLSQAAKAARWDAQSQAALLESARLLVEAEVAQTYLELRALDVERSLVRGTVRAYRETLDLTERRYRAGDVAELDVERVRSEVAANESEALALDRRRAQLEHALAVLVGEVASSFTLAEADWSTALPIVPAGVPGAVLARRPDVAAAQSALLAAQARVGVAKAAWFPDIALTAAAGQASTDVGDLFRWSLRAWSAAAVLALPIFDGGRREAGVRNAGAEMDAALARYRERILGAVRDVEDQLAALRLLAEQARAQDRAVQAAARSTSLSDVRYRNGLVSQLELLDARRSELRNRRDALQVRSAQYQATVGLIRALGGGWEGQS